MSITASNLASTATTNNATSYGTASPVAMVANRLYLASVAWSKASNPDAIVVTSTGGTTFTTIEDVSFNSTASPGTRLQVLRAMPTANDTSIIETSFGGATQTGCAIAIEELIGTATSGTNGAGAIVQSTFTATAGVDNLTVTLGAFSSANNATYAAFSRAINAAMVMNLVTELTDNGYGTPATRLETGWQVTSANPRSSAGTTTAWAGIALEIAVQTASTGAATTRVVRRTLMGVGV